MWEIGLKEWDPNFRSAGVRTAHNACELAGIQPEMNMSSSSNSLQLDPGNSNLVILNFSLLFRTQNHFIGFALRSFTIGYFDIPLFRTTMYFLFPLRVWNRRVPHNCTLGMRKNLKSHISNSLVFACHLKPYKINHSNKNGRAIALPAPPLRIPWIMQHQAYSRLL